MALSGKQQIFVDEYLKTKNATRAALAAGYSERSATEIGYENLRKPHISKVIAEHFAESAMGKEEVLARLADQARGTLAPFIRQSTDGENIGIDLSSDEAKANLHLIKKISQRRTVRTKGEDEEIEDTTLSIELHDPQAALNILAKHHNLFSDAPNAQPPATVVIYMPDNGRNDRDQAPTGQAN